MPHTLSLSLAGRASTKRGVVGVEKASWVPSLILQFRATLPPPAFLVLCFRKPPGAGTVGAPSSASHLHQGLAPSVFSAPPVIPVMISASCWMEWS